MTISSLIEFADDSVALAPLPIRKEWILEGNPEARAHVLSRSADGSASMLFWDCTAGRFNWIYTFDESVYFLEGEASIKDQYGNTRRVKAGDTVFFPEGSSAEWTVEKYIRKVAFMRATVPTPVAFGVRAFRKLKRMVSGSQEGAPMFG